MYRVTNLSSGRVQIRTSGRATLGHKDEIVESISVGLIRLRDAGLVKWEELGKDLKAKPADAPPPPQPPAPVKAEPKKAEEAKSEILAIAGEGIKEILPVAEALEEAPAPKKAKKAKKPKPPPAPEVVDEPDTDADGPAPVEPEPEDQRITDERKRLSDAGWSDLKTEAKDSGIKGRSRETIETRLLEAFVSKLG